METMALGLFSLTCWIISICCLYYQKPVWVIVCSTTTMVLTYLTGTSWKELLIAGGKNTALLGFHRYPAAPMILTILLLAALLLMIVGIIGVVRQNKSRV